MTPPRVAALISAGLLVAAWIIGLSVGGQTVEVLDGVLVVTGSADSGLLQPVLVHGVAAAALVGLGVSLGSLLASRLVAGLIIVAAGLSLAQLACELVLAEPSADLGVWGTALILLDGVKMIVLAAAMIAVLFLTNRSRSAKFALTPVTILAAASILLSGIGYLLMSRVLMLAAYVSLPLLLIWAVTAAIVADHRIVRKDDADAAK